MNGARPKPSRQALIRLCLAVLLLAQWGGLHAHCLRAAWTGLEGVPICGPNGETVRVASDGQTDQQADRAPSSVCPSCCAIHAIEPPSAPGIAALVRYAAIDRPTLPAGLPPLPPRAPPQQPRAPPILI